MAEELEFLGDWQIVGQQPASWLDDAGRQQLSNLPVLGRIITFTPQEVLADLVFGCSDAHYERIVLPADGLFQGNLPAPATTAAQELGLTQLPAPGVEVICDSGLFDYHFAGPDRLLTALDNEILTLERAPAAAAGTSEVAAGRAVAAFYRFHLAHDMAFTEDNLGQRQNRLSPDLYRLLADELQRPSAADEAPYINVDPFTDTQEYPTGFQIVQSEHDHGKVKVKVDFALLPQRRTVIVQLIPVADRWLIDDLTYEDGQSLRGLLSAPH
jgi:hypothetical protein